MNPPQSNHLASPAAYPGFRGQLSPRRREHVAQPPALVTSLGGAQFHGLGVIGLSSSGGVGPSSAVYNATPPASTSSLSGPFSVNHQNQSPYLPSPGAASRGTSPMASRFSSSSGFSAPYNPQEWGPVGVGSPHLSQGAFGHVRQPSSQLRNSSSLSQGTIVLFFVCP